MTSLAKLKEVDRRWKPLDAHRHWEAQAALYADAATDLVRARLREQCVGQANDLYPLQFPILRRLVDVLSVTYRRPGSRYLRNPVGRRLSESSAQHRNMVEAYRVAQMDAILKEADKRRSLFRQVVLRLYADDTRRGIAVRIFSPLNVMRWPDPSNADDIARDYMFALKQTDNRWEMWSRLNPATGLPGETWRMEMVDHDGQVLPTPELPFGTMPEPMTSPYSTPPVLMVFDGITAGDPWLAPRHSRSSLPLMLATMGGLQVELARLQAHSEIHFSQDKDVESPAKTADLPKDSGPGVRTVLPPGVGVEQVQPSPALEAVQSVTERMLSMFAQAEDVPHDLFRRSQVVTGTLIEGWRTESAPWVASVGSF